MPSDSQKLASEMHDAQGFPAPVSDRIKGMAEAVIQHFKEMMVVNFLPGTVKGTCPPGGPLQAGEASAGLIVGISGPALAVLIAQKIGQPAPTAKLIGFATGIATHVLTGKVIFSPGKITGVCSNTASTPGPFIGSGSGGKITGLTGSSMADLIAAGLGESSVSPKLLSMCGAIVKHLQQQSEILLPAATVQGLAPSGGGPLSAGTAAGGKFT